MEWPKRVVAGLVAAGAALGAVVEFFIVLLQVSPSFCATVRDQPGPTCDLGITLDAVVSVAGLVLTVVTVYFGFACAFDPREGLWRRFLAVFGAAALAGLYLWLGDVPNQ